MNNTDTRIVSLLIKNGRMAYADIARELGVSRAHVRERVKKLQEDGVIEQFTAVINPEKLGKTLSAFLDVKVAPVAIEELARELSQQPEVVSLYIMSDLQSLHIHTLTQDFEALDRFTSRHIFSRPNILSAECKTLLSRVKHRRGGPRL